MARLTKEEREAATLEYNRQEQERVKQYKESIPILLFDIQALASSLGIGTYVGLTSAGPTLDIRNSDDPFFKVTLTYNSEEWEIEDTRQKLDTEKSRRDAKAAQYLVAKSAFDKLSDEEKIAIVENVYSLKRLV